MKNRKEEKRKAGVRWGLVAGIILVCLISYATVPRLVVKQVEKDDGTLEYHVIWEGNLAMASDVMKINS